MRNGIKIVWLGCEEHTKIDPKYVQKTAIFDIFEFAQTLSIQFERYFVPSFFTVNRS